ncbi:MAG TPA: AraC family transcriptional regulator [Geminicoccaceae bacterium]|nr:AraC family transcriptional regulator [Geminicoccaceae bacterium]
MPTKPMVDALWVPPMVRTLRDAGWSEARITSTLGLRLDQIRLQRRIPLAKYLALLELAGEVSRDPCFGLHFGATHAFNTIGLLAYIMRNSPNLGAAITNAMRYLRLHVDAAELSLAFAGPEVRLIYRLTDPSIPPCRYYSEVIMVCFLKFVRLGIDDGWAPHEVQFRHGPPADLAPYHGLFGGLVRFDQSDDAMLFERQLLSRPLRTADHQLLRFLEEHARAVLAELPVADDDLIGRLQKFVVSALPHDGATLSAAARALGMSVRTLQRRLQTRGIVYARLVDDVRRRPSGKYLADPSLSLGEIAYLLGYSESSAFNRAYRRWTGRTPSADRRSVAA